jgi:putative Holliday junction resolvase
MGMGSCLLFLALLGVCGAFSFGGGLGPTLAVDYGTVRVGLAVGVGIAPRPLATLPNTKQVNHTDMALQVVARAQAEGSNLMSIIVGLPLHRNGSESHTSELARNFSQELANHWGAARGAKGRVLLWDERFTSKEAEMRLSQGVGGHWVKGSVDSIAATCILEHYFDEGGKDAELVPPASGITKAAIAVPSTVKAGISLSWISTGRAKDAPTKTPKVSQKRKKRTAKKRERGENIDLG